MTRTEKLLAELIALPSVNPAFVPQVAQASRLHPTVEKGRRDACATKKFGEKNVADYLASIAARTGLEVEFQKVDCIRWGETPGEPPLANISRGSRGCSPHQNDLVRSNLIARLLPQNRIRQTILLAPHLDTVNGADSQFIPRRKNGRLYGRGACDTKGSVAAMLTALCELAESKSRPQETEIVFIGLIDEEHVQAGSRALAKSKFKADLAIVGEPTQCQIVTAHKGSLWLELETHGRAAHGATPQFGKNAIHEMARIVDLLETDYAMQLRKRKHPLLGHPTVNVGTISGGVQPNIVPDHCTITIDRRTLPDETDRSVQIELQKFLHSKKLSASITDKKLAPALSLETNYRLPLVQQFMKCAGQNQPAGVHFFCDAAVLSAGGIPSVVFGPGDVAQAHTAEEWISLTELEHGKNLILKFLQSLG